MAVTEHKEEQRSPEWYKSRMALVTSSRAAPFLSKKTTIGYNKLIKEIILEQRGEMTEDDVPESTAVLNGIKFEPYILNLVDMLTADNYDSCGFFTNSAHPLFGASPDAVVRGERGKILSIGEFKTRTSATQFTNDLKKGYFGHRKQIAIQMLVTGASRGMYATLYVGKDKLKDAKSVKKYGKYPYFMTEIKRDEELIQEILDRGKEFLVDLAEQQEDY